MTLVGGEVGAGRAAEPREALRYADALHNLARYLVRDAAEAEDLVQETYAHALKAWPRLLPGSDLRAWLFRILRNLHLSRRRHDWRAPAPEPYDTLEVEAPASAGGTLLGDADLARVRGLVAADIEAALRRLTDDARTVVLLDLEGFTEGEVAEVLGCAVGTVKSRLARARAALRALLAEYAPRSSP